MINNEKGDEKVKIIESEYKDLKSQKLCSNQDKSKQFISNKALGIRITVFFYRHQEIGLCSGFSSWVWWGG